MWKALNRSMVVGGAARASVGFGSQADLNLENLMSAVPSKAEILLGCQFVTGRRRFNVWQLARFLEFWLNSIVWSDERHSGAGF